MSQKVTRNSAVAEEKDKPRDSPVKDTKKKMAATEKAAENEKPADKNDQNVDKNEKLVKHDVQTDKGIDKKVDKKSDTQTDKTKEESSKGEKSIKEKKEKEADKKTIENGNDVKENSKEVVANGKEVVENGKGIGNGQEVVENGKKVVETAKIIMENGTSHNGVSDVTLSKAGRNEVLNGTVSEDSSDDGDEMMIIDDHDQDELFPELTYDDTSDVECFESPTPENLPSRSFTRRSQPKDGKALKVKEDLTATDRKLRSADSPKPGEKKTQDKPQESKKVKDKTPEPSKKTPEPPKKSQDSPKKVLGSPKKAPGSPKKATESPKKVRDDSKDRETESKVDEKENGVKEIELEVEIVVDSDGSQDEPRKLDTNYSKSRVKVSPYRRSMRLADQTTSSVMANYTGNNTTMEMDITETSSYVSLTEEPSVDDSPYLTGLRNIRGRRSYKPLKEMTLRHVTANKGARSANVSVPEIPSSRPTGTVVGRKRKPDGEEEPAEKVDLTTESEDLASVVRSKRMRLLDKISQPFKRTLASTPIPRRAAEIVGINTDLPLTAPVDPEPFDPESLKPAADVSSKTTELTQTAEKDSKRCVVM